MELDDALVEVGGGQVPPVALHMLDRSPVVASWTGFNYADAELDGQTVPLLRVDVRAAFLAPHRPRLPIRGTEKSCSAPPPWPRSTTRRRTPWSCPTATPEDALDYIPPTRLRIVGTATLPAIGNPATLHPLDGYGGHRGERCRAGCLPPHSPDPDPNLNGPALAVVRLRSGVSPAAGRAVLEQISRATTRRSQRTQTPARPPR